MLIPANPKLYHIVHIDRLASIIATGGLLSDAQIATQAVGGSMIGMGHIKQRRLQELTLTTHPGLTVGQCVPFYFCPRSIMLYIIYQANSSDLAYKGGQGPIVHLQTDLNAVVAWANQQQRRWAFTLSNAGSRFFEDRNDLACLNELDWPAIQTNQWQGRKDGKQAEFLLEQNFPWHLVEVIGVCSQPIYQQAMNALNATPHKPAVAIKPEWYY
ncbi:MAG: type II toxin-antitoxin system toxin DNA ADP-ribosyl transferase DarT [Cellvibrionaceae bacterium]